MLWMELFILGIDKSLLEIHHQVQSLHLIEKLQYIFFLLNYSTLEPQAISKLVSYFNPLQTTITFQEAVFYAGLKIGLKITHGMVMQNYFIYIQQLAIRLRTAFCSMVYRKALKLTPEAMNEINLGNVITVVTKDVMIFEHNIGLFNNVWVELLSLWLLSYLIYNKMGWTGLVGVGILLVSVPVQSK